MVDWGQTYARVVNISSVAGVSGQHRDGVSMVYLCSQCREQELVARMEPSTGRLEHNLATRPLLHEGAKKPHHGVDGSCK